MKLHIWVKIILFALILLFCLGIGTYSYKRLSAVEQAENFDLYTLVPASTTAILETDHMVEFIQEVNELSCSKEDRFLFISKLFSYLKLHLHTLVEQTPHGLSKQMNKLLISFHAPDNDRNQVLYCTLGNGDYELVERFIKEYCISTFPSKIFDYKGQEIRIYPMADDHFLACYFTTQFIAISYQKKLIEEVIDARLSGKSLINDKTFERVHAGGRRTNTPATIYVRMHSVDLGKTTDGIPSQSQLGGWTEFDMKMNGDVIYFSGVSHENDSTRISFTNALRCQEPVEGFPGEILPASTFFFNKWAVSDLHSMFRFTSSHEYSTATYSNYIKDRDEEMLGFFMEYAGDNLVTSLFHPADTLEQLCAVMSFPIQNVTQAERRLRNLIQTTPPEDTSLPVKPREYYHSMGWTYTFYPLPRNTLFTQLTGITESALHTYASFYKGRLLIAPDTESLSSYIYFLDRGEILDDTPAYEEGISSLSATYNFMQMVDFGDIFIQPENYVRLIPNFFFRNQDFFRHFILATQFTCSNGMIYPNIVLIYKGS